MFSSNRVRVLVSMQPLLTHICMCCRAMVDFRKGHDGLASIVSSLLRNDPFTGTVFSVPLAPGNRRNHGPGAGSGARLNQNWLTLGTRPR